jgi:SAM-dependent methyltransferase
MNYYLRELGGKWSWADLEDKSITEMEDLLGDTVHHVQNGALPFPDLTFDRVVSIDVHEHMQDPVPFTKELRRVAKNRGQIIVTVPNGDERKWATRIKNAVGMTKEEYGHVTEGYDIPHLKSIMKRAHIEPIAESSFSKFFTEMLELSINFLYVKILSRKSNFKVKTGTIAPTTKNQLKSIEKTYKLYSLVYPIVYLISRFDILFFFTRGYAVMVKGKKKKVQHDCK